MMIGADFSQHMITVGFLSQSILNFWTLLSIRLWSKKKDFKAQSSCNHVYVSKLKVNCKFGRLALQAIPIFSCFQFSLLVFTIDFFNCNSFVHNPVWHESDFFRSRDSNWKQFTRKDQQMMSSTSYQTFNCFPHISEVLV